MFSVFFGQYLLNNGIIEAEELNSLLEISRKTKVKLGVLAINSGLLTVDNVNKINIVQSKLDMRFGEIAIQEGYLTEPELEMLLAVQETEHLKLSQTLIDKNLLTLEEIQNHLSEYKKLYSLDDDKFEQLKDGNAETIINAYLNFDNDSFSDLYKEYITLYYKNVVRFIDSSVRIDNVEVIDSVKYDFLIKQEIVGPKRIYTGFAGQVNTLVKFAAMFADEAFNSLDDYAQDALGEFLNLNNGLYLVNLSDYGVDLDLKIQSIHKNFVVESNKVYSVPMYLTFGKIDLLISLNPIV